MKFSIKGNGKFFSETVGNPDVFDSVIVRFLFSFFF